MGWRVAAIWLLLTSTITISCSNIIIDDVQVTNDSSLINIAGITTRPDSNKEETTTNILTSSLSFTTNTDKSDDSLLSISNTTTTTSNNNSISTSYMISTSALMSTTSPTTISSLTTVTLTNTDEDKDGLTVTNATSTTVTTRNTDITPPPTVDVTSDETNKIESIVVRSSEILESITVPEPSLEEIDNVGVENEVQTTHGPVKGFQWRGISGIMAYIDIPYGAIDGYFKPPKPPKLWEEVHQVTEHKKRCPQIIEETYVGDNECLTLSIFTPNNPVNASVLFHIHESHFISGSGDPAIYGPEYLVSRGIILALPNYRLGPPGFLCLRNDTAPGNAALKDLTLALAWIRNNIAAFGGDPADITVSGDGTAGALVGYLALSPKSNGYISKVITESGSVLSHWAIDRNPGVTADILADKIKKSEDKAYNNTFDEADIESIITSSKNVVLKPCIEHGEAAFIVYTPWEMLHQGYNNMSFMMGSANLAGAREAFFQTADSIAHLNEDFGQALPNDLHFNNHEQRNQISKRVRTQYFNDSDISVERVRELALCYTDASYLGPGIRTARPLIRAGAEVYLYEFSFIGVLNRELLAIDKALDGAVKGDVVGYIFTQDGFIPAENTEESKMVNLMTDLWASFIKTGKPTAEGIEWEHLSVSEDSEEVYLSIGSRREMKRGIHVDRIRLWTQIYDEHFIEHNRAFMHRTSVYAAIVLLLMMWFGFCKNASHL